MSQPALHKDFRYRVEHVGNERQPVLVIDNYLAQVESLVEMAASYGMDGGYGQFTQADTYYPGVRAKVPDLYAQVMNHYLHDLVAETFGLRGDNVTKVNCNFSMVMTAPNQLKPAQTIPHSDSAKRSELAAVHYLCSPDKGGTSLYRHRATGFEAIDDTRVDGYKQLVNEQMAARRVPPSYMNGSNDLFEQIASYEAQFNRLVMYRCISLHSGNIAPDFVFDPDPRRGRLTLNTLIYCRE